MNRQDTGESLTQNTFFKQQVVAAIQGSLRSVYDRYVLTDIIEIVPDVMFFVRGTVSDQIVCNCLVVLEQGGMINVFLPTSFVGRMVQVTLNQYTIDHPWISGL